MHDAEGKKCSVNQQQHGNCSSSKQREGEGNHAELSEKIVWHEVELVKFDVLL
jgi:hypothetical protein